MKNQTHNESLVANTMQVYNNPFIPIEIATRLDLQRTKRVLKETHWTWFSSETNKDPTTPLPSVWLWKEEEGGPKMLNTHNLHCRCNKAQLFFKPSDT